MNSLKSIILILITILLLSCKNDVSPFLKFDSHSNDTYFCFVDGENGKKCDANRILHLIKNDYKASRDFGSSKCRVTILSGSALESQKLYLEIDAKNHFRAAKGDSKLKWYNFELKNTDNNAVNYCDSIIEANIR